MHLMEKLNTYIADLKNNTNSEHNSTILAKVKSMFENWYFFLYIYYVMF